MKGWDLGGAEGPCEKEGVEFTVVDMFTPEEGTSEELYIQKDLTDETWGLEPRPYVNMSCCLRDFCDTRWGNEEWTTLAKNIARTVTPLGEIQLVDVPQVLSPVLERLLCFGFYVVWFKVVVNEGYDVEDEFEGGVEGFFIARSTWIITLRKNNE